MKKGDASGYAWEKEAWPPNEDVQRFNGERLKAENPNYGCRPRQSQETNQKQWRFLSCGRRRNKNVNIYL